MLSHIIVSCIQIGYYYLPRDIEDNCFIFLNSLIERKYSLLLGINANNGHNPNPNNRHKHSSQRYYIDPNPSPNPKPCDRRILSASASEEKIIDTKCLS